MSQSRATRQDAGRGGRSLCNSLSAKLELTVPLGFTMCDTIQVAKERLLPPGSVRVSGRIYVCKQYLLYKNGCLQEPSD